MPGPVTITDGGFCEKDSDDALVYVFDYDTLNLPAGVLLAGAGTFIISPDDGQLTKDNEALVVGSRKTQLRLLGGRVEKRYIISNRVTTNQSPVQIKEKRFYLRIKS